jgi:hypothetical protein
MTYLYHDLKYMWEQMREAQQNNGGFDLTVRELCGVFHVVSLNSVFYRLKLLQEAGFVVAHPHGRKHVYRAVEFLSDSNVAGDKT